MNDKDVCRTAPAPPGLFIMITTTTTTRGILMVMEQAQGIHGCTIIHHDIIN